MGHDTAAERLARGTSRHMLQLFLAQAEACVAEGCRTCAREVKTYRAALARQDDLPRGTPQTSQTPKSQT